MKVGELGNEHSVLEVLTCGPVDFYFGTAAMREAGSRATIPGRVAELALRQHRQRAVEKHGLGNGILC
ncbi:hypothetical protein [Jannaschia aquimarina]|uniref:hypothetical protein n=1 Tax=Jannaschia aquimarina TaxID=935700 RepID=UPI001379129F|nr:hypothetical protein [Jannaschia aquimarina]